MPLEQSTQKDSFRYCHKTNTVAPVLRNRISRAVLVMLSTITWCASAPLLAQPRDDGSDVSVLLNETTDGTERVTRSSSLRETGSKSAAERARSDERTKERQSRAKRETEITETDISQTEKPQLSWKSEWPRHRLYEYLAIPVLGITTFTLRTQVDNPDHARLQGGLLFDRPMQDLLRLSNSDHRLMADTLSDFGFFGLQLYPFVVDVLLVSLIIHELPDIALELAVMTLQAFAISNTVVTFTKKVVGRERPYSEQCESEGDHTDPECSGTERYASFFSGHTLGAFTGAGLICAQHQVLDLYEGGAVEEVACGSALALASVTGVLRVMSDRHWFSDVLTSAAIGLASGWLMPWLLHFQFDTGNTQNSAFNNGMLIPLLDDKVYGIGYFSAF
jgi:membrane-associated phospholipid phosphatase